MNVSIKFQKILALAAAASNRSEAKAAELAARRLMEASNIDPMLIPDQSLYSRMNFADNALLKKLRDEWREVHPDHHYKTVNGHTRRLRGKPRRPVNTTTEMFTGLFDDYLSPETTMPPVNTKPKPKPSAKPVNTKPMDRNRDRHSKGYMREYMRQWRAKQR